MDVTSIGMFMKVLDEQVRVNELNDAKEVRAVIQNVVELVNELFQEPGLLINYAKDKHLMNGVIVKLRVGSAILHDGQVPVDNMPSPSDLALKLRGLPDSFPQHTAFFAKCIDALEATESVEGGNVKIEPLPNKKVCLPVTEASSTVVNGRGSSEEPSVKDESIIVSEVSDADIRNRDDEENKKAGHNPIPSQPTPYPRYQDFASLTDYCNAVKVYAAEEPNTAGAQLRLMRMNEKQERKKERNKRQKEEKKELKNQRQTRRRQKAQAREQLLWDRLMRRQQEEGQA